VPKPEKNYFEPSISIVVEGDLLHRAVTRVEPEYPEVAMKARIAGTVGAEVIVDPDGRVMDTRITKPLPFGLDQAVKDALSQWTFAPSDVRSSGLFVVRFELLRVASLKVTTVHCSWR
jgi:TonB family protein